MLPKVVLYNSMSLDGCLNGFEINKKIFNEIEAQETVDAVIMDPKTFEIRFNRYSKEINRLKSIKLLVVPDSTGSINWKSMAETCESNNILVLCSRSTPQEYMDLLEKNNINYMIIGFDDVNMATALEELNTQFGIKIISVQADGCLNGKLLRDELVEEIYVLLHPILVGGNKQDSLYVTPNINSEDQIFDLRLLEMKGLENELIFLKYRIMKYKF